MKHTAWFVSQQWVAAWQDPGEDPPLDGPVVAEGAGALLYPLWGDPVLDALPEGEAADPAGPPLADGEACVSVDTPPEGEAGDPVGIPPVGAPVSVGELAAGTLSVGEVGTSVDTPLEGAPSLAGEPDPVAGPSVGVALPEGAASPLPHELGVICGTV